MNSQQFKKTKLPKTPGVYFFRKGKDILYIGKATSLQDRLKSYFGKDPEGKITSNGAGLMATRGPHIVKMVEDATSIRWEVTDSMLEALILEANLIKKYQPKYNTKEKDDKSFNYVCITDEKIPKVLVIRGRILKKEDYQAVYGPFPNGLQLREAMKIVRRIFPFIDEQSSKRNNREFYRQLGLIPNFEMASQKCKNFSRFTLKGSDTDKNFYISASLIQYKKNIKNLKLFFEGKKKSIITNLKKDMALFSELRDFENAAKIRDQIFALNHINDVALIKEEASQHYLNFPRFTLKRAQTTDKNLNNVTSLFTRIEAYDIAHMSGSNMVGVMTVIIDGELAKSEYKKFIVRTQTGANDTGALEEVLSRRLRHIEWGLPDLIVMDGSTAQINVAKSVLNRYQFQIPIVGVVKDDKHKAKAIMGDEVLIKKYKKEILLINNEAHRFAITFHKQRRNKNFLKMEEMK